MAVFLLDTYYLHIKLFVLNTLGENMQRYVEDEKRNTYFIM